MKEVLDVLKTPAERWLQFIGVSAVLVLLAKLIWGFTWFESAVVGLLPTFAIILSLAIVIVIHPVRIILRRRKASTSRLPKIP